MFNKRYMDVYICVISKRFIYVCAIHISLYL